MEEANIMALELLEQATKEEKELFDKVVRSTEEKVFDSFGKTKDEVLGAFMMVWVKRIK